MMTALVTNEKWPFQFLSSPAMSSASSALSLSLGIKSDADWMISFRDGI